MNILFVCAEYPYQKNSSTGGFGRYIETITLGLVKAGHHVTVLCKSRSLQNVKPLNRNNSTIIILNSIGKNVLDKLYMVLPFSFIKRLITFFDYPLLWSLRIYIYLKKFDKDYDIIEGGDFGAELFFYLLLKKKSRSTIIKLHTPSFVIREYNDEPETFFYRALSFLETFCLKRATSLNSPTKSLASIVSQIIRRDIDTIIPYPIYPSPKELWGEKDRNVILYVGKLQPKKGVFVFLKAIPLILKKIQREQFIFVGPDTISNGQSTRKIMQEFIESHNITNNIVIFDEVDKDDLNKLYRKAFITVVPSLWENFPYVAIEAILHESIVVASNIGGLRELIKDRENGFLFRKGDHTTLADLIIRIHHDSKIDAIRMRAKKDIEEKYNLDLITDMTTKYYEAILQKKP